MTKKALSILFFVFILVGCNGTTPTEPVTPSPTHGEPTTHIPTSNPTQDTIDWDNKEWVIEEGKEFINVDNNWLSLGNNNEHEIILRRLENNIENGLYYLTVETLNQGNQEYCYIYTKNSQNEVKKTSIPSYIDKNNSIITTVRGVEILDGTIEIGIVSKGKNTSASLKNIKLIKENNQSVKYPSLFGGAISWIDWEEDMGAKYYDEEGNQKDALLIMKEHGCNFVRLELYNNPGAYKDGDGNYFPANYKNQDSILALAKRAKALDMEIELSFMYSDYWGNDVIPSDWAKGLEELSSFDDEINYLNQEIYEWTSSFMERLKSESIYPRYVSLGNEIDPGFLIPYGALYSEEKNEKALCSFINTGYQAVKDVSPSSQVVLHLGCNANDMFWANHNGSGKTFFQIMKNNNVNYDVIGTSFYPFWAQTDNQYASKNKLDLIDLKNWCELMIDTFDKDVLIMETGINWGTPGQLANNGAYEGIYSYTPEGQRDYVINMINTVKSVKDGRCVGSLYWDPILVRQQGVGWALYDDGKARDNCVETTTFFDYDHVALPVLSAYIYN